MKAEQVKKELRKLANPAKAKFLKHFFKTAEGEYGEGDKFLGISVPETRKIAQRFLPMELKETEKLLHSAWHEERLLALVILVKKFEKANLAEQKKIFNFYLQNTAWINNWDLVDLSAPNIVGEYLVHRNKNILYKLAKSKSLWERRIAILATFAFLKQKSCEETFKIAELLLEDKEDLMHKAVGWLLRETGKRCSVSELEKFLKKHGGKMPRTALRYAIERFPEAKRKKYLLTR